MGHLKMPSNQIKRAVLSCNTSILSEARLTQMEAFAPDKREVNILLLCIVLLLLLFVVVYCCLF